MTLAKSFTEMNLEMLFDTLPDPNFPTENITWEQLQERCKSVVNSETDIRALLGQNFKVTAGGVPVAQDGLQHRYYLDFLCTVGLPGADSFASVFPEEDNSLNKFQLQSMVSNRFKTFSAKHTVFPFSLKKRCFFLGNVRTSAQAFLIFPPGLQHVEDDEGKDGDTMIDQNGVELLNHYISELFDL